ncbi:MAG: thiol oxidoreductase [Flavobacteriales bacterium]|nr:thiol oxidoreductase [Flavobacteriales bacterium]
MRNKIIILSTIFLGLYSCTRIIPKKLPEEEILAKPIDGLTQNELAIHIQGDELFAKIFTPDNGLGPIFVQSSCESCHVGDGKGNPINSLTRFGRYLEDSINGQVWDPMLALGGPQIQNRSIQFHDPETLPEGAQASVFLAPLVSGTGYLDAVDDQYLIDLVASQMTEGVVSGRLNYIEAPDYLDLSNKIPNAQGLYIGRFGRKGGAVNLLHQTITAYNQDMGITTNFEPLDPINVNSNASVGDLVQDPEISDQEVHAVEFYVRTLAAPPRRDLDKSEVLNGEDIFKQIGCEHCHKAILKTGNNTTSYFDEVEFYPYTDMLFHDMGPELDDGYTEGNVATSEWKTTPLWGLGLQRDLQGSEMFLLHDGRAKTFEGAINYHGGEASFSRTNFQELSDEDKADLFSFLSSL